MRVAAGVGSQAATAEPSSPPVRSTDHFPTRVRDRDCSEGLQPGLLQVGPVTSQLTILCTNNPIWA